VIDTLLLALALMLSLTLYALLGGADYGGGLWDLLASGPTADRQRATIARAIGPIWEANHVWLIIAIVIVFTGFPHAFAAVSTYLHVPLLLVLIGIVLRGSAFVFRAYGAQGPRLWGRVFAIASIATPFFLGVVIGAITDGRLPTSPSGSFAEVFLHPWLTPFALAVGLFALALFGYLAAVYLTLEAQDADERAAFRARALAAGVAVGVLAAVVLVLAAPEVRHGLIASPWAVPLQVAAGASAAAAWALVWRGSYRPARLAAALQVAFILWGWGLAHYPYAVRPELTLAEAAAPRPVRVILLQVLAVGAVVLLPSLLYLFGVFGPRGGEAPRAERGGGG
jgi:cytochrome d ubiquinol oxidase subunit II